MKFGKFNSVLDMLYEYEIENILSIIALYPCILLLFGWKNQKKILTQKHISVHFICMVEFFERQQCNVEQQQLIHRVPKSRRIYYNNAQWAKKLKKLVHFGVYDYNFFKSLLTFSKRGFFLQHEYIDCSFLGFLFCLASM